MFRQSHSLINGVLGASAAFSPGQISGLVEDWNADTVSGADGDVIGTWTGAYASIAASATTTLRPTLKLAIQNGRACLRFAGAQGMATPNIDLSGTGALTVYVVGNPSTSGSDQVLVERTANYNSAADGFIVYRTSGNQYIASHIGNVAGADSWTTADGTTPRKLTTTPRVLSTVFDKSQVAANEVRLYRGGTLFGSSSGAANNTTQSFGSAKALYFGARNQASLFLTGDIYRILLYSGAHTATQRWQIETYLGRYYDLEPQSGMIIFEGDSLTYGSDGSGGRQTTPYPTALIASVSGKYAWDNYGVAGQTLAQMESDAATQIDVNYRSAISYKPIVVWGGTNDMGTAGGANSAATTFGRLQTYCNSRRSAGWTIANNAPIYVLTCLARNDANAPGDFETKRQAYNTLIKAGDSSYDYVIDLATDSRLDDGTGTLPAGVDSGDHVHLTNTGYGYVAALVKTALGI